MSDTVVNLELRIDEAVVLFESLADFHDAVMLRNPNEMRTNC
jgi:hypothetical protein